MARPLFGTDPIQLPLVSWIWAFPALLFVCCRIEAQSPDRDAMLAVWSKLIGNDSSSNKLRSWNGSIPYCDWEGVTCDIDGAVTDLSLQVLLGGSISQEVGNLTRLQNVHLRDCGLGGTIPITVNNLTSLTILDLSLNMLTGPIPRLDRLTNLRELYLSQNNLDGTIPATIDKLQNLKILDLSSNMLMGTIPTLESFTSLTFLDLSNNGLTGGISGWDWKGGDWPKSPLQTFRLSRNQLSGSIPGTLLLYIQNLDLSFNSFNTLNMSTGVEGHYVGFPRYGVYSHVKSLDLSHNKLQSDAAYTFPGQFFGRLVFVDLEQMWLEENLLSGDISIYLFDFFHGDSYSSAFPILKVLKCAGNNISGEVKLSGNRNDPASGQLLQVLDLSRNPNLGLFETALVDESPLHIILLGRFPFLRELRLSNISHTGVLPQRIGYLVSLEVLDLSHSNLSGVMADVFNNETLTALQYLDLSHNEIWGEVPEALNRINGLEYLDLSYNNLSGQLPSFLSQDSKSGGRRVRFNASSFTGNPGLCGDPLPACPEAHVIFTRSLTLILVIISTSLIAMTSGVLVAWRWTVYYKRHRQDADLVEVLQKSATLTMPLQELKRATENFSAGRKIGQGGFGAVYYGKLDDGTPVAIKRSSRVGFHGQPDKKRFLNEVKILSQVNHQNLVKLLGCCLANKIDALVFEYVPNGTLLEHLRRKRGGAPLSWSERLLIGLQTADALAYLHFSASPPIYHLDVKSANILLTDQLHAKVADFGISKLAPREGTWITRPVGTPGYMDPEYFASCKPTDRSDVFSFGVVLLELISGQPVIDFSRSTESPGLLSFALPLIRAGELDTLVDPFLSETTRGTRKREELMRAANLAERCLRERSKDRPTMKEVWNELQALWATSGDSGAETSNSIVEEPPDSLRSLLSEKSTSTDRGLHTIIDDALHGSDHDYLLSNTSSRDSQNLHTIVEEHLYESEPLPGESSGRSSPNLRIIVEAPICRSESLQSPVTSRGSSTSWDTAPDTTCGNCIDP